MKKAEKIAIVYDWFDKWGGVERILLTLHELFPDASFYTSYYDKKNAAWANSMDIHESYIRSLPYLIKHSRILSLPFYPFAFESFNFNEYGTVISVTSSFAKSIITQPGTQHICYLLTPTRFLWSGQKEYHTNSFPKHMFLPYFQKWDQLAAQRPDSIISISKTVQKRCATFYKRDSEVIYPPFDTRMWDNQIPKPFTDKLDKTFFLVVSRLEPYKRIDLAIETFNASGMKLVVVGSGSEEKKLKTMAKGNIHFYSHLSDGELVHLYRNAKALIMPQEEDFGYVAVEAQYFGCPVITYSMGGVTEIVKDGITGLFFDTQTIDSLNDALERFHTMSYNLTKQTKRYGKEFALKHSKEEFKKQFLPKIKINL